MENKTCSMSDIEKFINDFYKKYAECEDCISKRELKYYYENKEKISNQRKKEYEKNKDKTLQQQFDRYIDFTELSRTYVDLENTFKAVDKKGRKKSSELNYPERNQLFYRRIFLKTPKKNYPTNKNNVYHIDDIYTLETSDLNDYGPEKN